MSRTAASFFFLAAVLLGLAAPGWGQDKPVILDSYGFWREYHQLRPPVMQTAGGLKPILLPQSWLNAETPAAPQDWAKPDFDDSLWYRGTVPGAIKSPWVSRIDLRGKFKVADPAAVGALSLSLEYHGGVVVYVNGKEAFRQNLPEGAVGPDTLAEAYPKEAFVTEDSKAGLFPEGAQWHAYKKPTDESARRMGLWSRKANVTIPANLLRPGVNVLAVEVVRSPYDAVVEDIKEAYRKDTANRDKNVSRLYQIFFTGCEIVQAQLKAASAAGIAPNATRPKDFQVWNIDPAAPIFDTQYGDPCEGLRPIALVGPRGGAVSGKVGVSGTKAIRGLRGAAGDLKSDGGVIPATAVRVRYGFLWGSEINAEPMRIGPCPYSQGSNVLGGISDTPPKECPVRSLNDGGYVLKYPDMPKPVNGAVAAVWATVKIPEGAKPGLYKGTLTVEAEGQAPVAVPVEVKVVDWAMPAPKDFVTLVDTVESPDTLSLEYNLEPWSEKHWEMIGRSMDFQGEIGNWTLYLPLLAHTNLGNEESLVRWIKKDGNRYEYDFTNFDRYLDTAEKHMGKPRVVVLSVWEVNMLISAELEHRGYATRDEMFQQNLKEHGAQIDQGPEVTVYDPAAKKTSTVSLPLLSDPASKGLWEPLLKGVQARLQKRGLDKALMFGINSDAWARKGQVAFFNDILPGTPWVVESHGGAPLGQLLYDLVKVGYQAHVWGVSFPDEAGEDGTGRLVTPFLKDAKDGHMYGWQQPELTATFERTPYLSDFPVARWRFFPEVNLTGAQRGVGRIAADGWRVIKGKDGRRVSFAHERYPEAHWRNLGLTNYLLAPGAKGPGTTTRYEAFREGLQETEARISIEQALVDPAQAGRLGADLVKRCRETLDARIPFMLHAVSNLQMFGGGYDGSAQYATGWRWAAGPWGQVWYLSSGWQQRSETLFTLAGDVRKALSQSH
jgi:hypothetical protein